MKFKNTQKNDSPRKDKDAQNIFPKFVNILSILTFLLCILSTSALAFSGAGTGTALDPYVVTTTSEWFEMDDEVNKTYVLGNNLNFSGVSFSSLENMTSNFDGKNFNISNIAVNQANVGLFGYIYPSGEGIEIKNFNLIDSNFDVATGSFGSFIVGRSDANISLSNIHISNSELDVLGTTGYYGGFVGYVGANTNVLLNNSGIDNDVFIDSNDEYTGGFVGYTRPLSNSIVTVSDSYFYGEIGGGVLPGCLVGYSKRYPAPSPSFTNVVSTCNMTGGNYVIRAFSDSASGTVASLTNFYYLNTDIIGLSAYTVSQINVTAFTNVADMQNESNYPTLDFTEVWTTDITINNGLPSHPVVSPYVEPEVVPPYYDDMVVDRIGTLWNQSPQNDNDAVWNVGQYYSLLPPISPTSAVSSLYADITLDKPNEEFTGMAVDMKCEVVQDGGFVCIFGFGNGTFFASPPYILEDGYYLYYIPAIDTWRLRVDDSGSVVVLDEYVSNGAVELGDQRMTLEHIGDEIKVYRNGIEIMSAVDNTFDNVNFNKVIFSSYAGESPKRRSDFQFSNVEFLYRDPSITNISPANEFISFNESRLQNPFTFNLDYTGAWTCDLNLNGSSVHTSGVLAGNTQHTLYSDTNIAYGTYDWNLNCVVDGIDVITPNRTLYVQDPSSPTMFEPNLSIVGTFYAPEGEQVTVEGIGCPAELNCQFYLDGLATLNPFNGSFNEGFYTFVYNTSGNENYTSKSVTQVVEITGLNSLFTFFNIQTDDVCPLDAENSDKTFYLIVFVMAFVFFFFAFWVDNGAIGILASLLIIYTGFVSVACATFIALILLMLGLVGMVLSTTQLSLVKT